MLQILEDDLKDIISNCMVCSMGTTTQCRFCEGKYYYKYDESMWLEIVKKYTI